MANKSKPIGIRFDLEKLDFVKTKEGLNTNQKVIDFLLNDYWWKYRVAKPSYKESPPLSLKEDDSIPIKNEIVKKQSKTIQQYVHDRMEINDPSDYDEWLSELESDEWLSSKDKQLAKTITF